MSTTLPTGTVCTVDEGVVSAPTGYSWTTFEAFTESNSDSTGDGDSATDGVVKVKDVSGTTVGVTIANTLTRQPWHADRVEEPHRWRQWVRRSDSGST